MPFHESTLGCLAAIVLLVGSIAPDALAQLPDPPRGNPFPPGDSILASKIAKKYKQLVPTLVASLGSKDEKIRKYAAASLLLIGKEAVPELVRVVKEKATRVDVLANACYVLGEIGFVNPETFASVEPLLKMMSHNEQEVKLRATRAVFRILGGIDASAVNDRDRKDPEAPAAAIRVEVPRDPGLLLRRFEKKEKKKEQ